MTENNVIQDSNIASDQQIEQPVDNNVPSTEQQVEPVVTDTPPEKIVIEGVGEFTIDDIKEMQKGNMRQSDYTKKTQQLAQERQEAKEALEFYNRIKENPEHLKIFEQIDSTKEDKVISDTVYKLTPEMQQIQELQRKIALKEIDDEIEKLKFKYEDFDEIKVLTEARNRNIDDLEFVYLALRDAKTNVDVAEIERLAIEKAKKELMAEIENNTQITTTIIDGGIDTPPKNIKLNEKELYIAKQMGISPEDYQKWKT